MSVIIIGICILRLTIRAARGAGDRTVAVLAHNSSGNDEIYRSQVSLELSIFSYFKSSRSYNFPGNLALNNNRPVVN